VADETFDPVFAEALGAFAFIAADQDLDGLRSMAKLTAELEESEGWKLIVGALARKREAILTELETLDPAVSGAVYARQVALAQALKWPARLPEVLSDLARRKEEEAKSALERSRFAAQQQGR
jgi:hypothetical protein